MFKASDDSLVINVVSSESNVSHSGNIGVCEHEIYEDHCCENDKTDSSIKSANVSNQEEKKEVDGDDSTENNEPQQKVTFLRLASTGEELDESIRRKSVMSSSSQKPYSSDIKLVKLEEKKWMCDVCKIATFDNFVVACLHEVSCKLSLTESVTSKDSESTKEIHPSSKVSLGSKESEGRLLHISMIPKNQKLISDYNLILTQNIELFEVPTRYRLSNGVVGFNLDDMPTSKIGLRCIHCAGKGQHITAASFFPSSVGSIASGLGTIGARHFIGGKCPVISEDVLQPMRDAKKVSQQQTRMQGRIGLDAYCKEFARTHNIVNHDIGGVCVYLGEEGKSFKNVVEIIENQFLEIEENAKQMLEKGSDNKNSETIIDRMDATAFVEGTVEHFWECGHCKSLPFSWRASGSVIFCATTPTINLVGKHLSICQGRKPLRIPRDATIEAVENTNGRSVRIRWDSMNANSFIPRKSDRIRRRISSNTSRKKRKTTDHVEEVNIFEGIEEKELALPEDKTFTTEFAHFTIMQLRKCYLTKSGGSRGSCPLGYPGLACIHCTGMPTERRFFYTSADHLRNSFSHIPAHLVVCSKCPDDVKLKIEELKLIRNKQKSQLKIGQHKEFIDRIWGRLHGPGGGIIENDDTQNDPDVGVEIDCEDDGSISSISVDLNCDRKQYQNESLDGKWLENEKITIEKTPSVLVLPQDRKLTTDYVYYSLLQMIPNVQSQECKSDANNAVTNFPELKDDGAPPSTFTEQNFDKDKGESASSSNPPSLIDESPELDSKKTSRESSIVCKHCLGIDETHTFLINSSIELRKTFSEIPKHLMLCQKCPETIKSKLKTFKYLRSSQEASLRRNMFKSFLNKVWDRYNNHVNNNDGTKSTIQSSAGLVTEDDRHLVTEFTFYTMEQMKPCNLENAGNGSRSMFQYGFPGLSCIHCAGTASERKFFYRTADILSGNYAHIPNHILSCKHCPVEVKSTLIEKKNVHTQQKSTLNRGSQREFFNNLWSRLHSRSH